MNQSGKESTTAFKEQFSSETGRFIKALWGVRYQVKNVSRSVSYYTGHLEHGELDGPAIIAAIGRPQKGRELKRATGQGTRRSGGG